MKNNECQVPIIAVIAMTASCRRRFLWRRPSRWRGSFGLPFSGFLKYKRLSRGPRRSWAWPWLRRLHGYKLLRCVCGRLISHSHKRNHIGCRQNHCHGIGEPDRKCRCSFRASIVSVPSIPPMNCVIRWHT